MIAEPLPCARRFTALSSAKTASFSVPQAGASCGHTRFLRWPQAPGEGGGPGPAEELPSARPRFPCPGTRRRTLGLPGLLLLRMPLSTGHSSFLEILLLVCPVSAWSGPAASDGESVPFPWRPHRLPAACGFCASSLALASFWFPLLPSSWARGAVSLWSCLAFPEGSVTLGISSWACLSCVRRLCGNVFSSLLPEFLLGSLCSVAASVS